MFAPTVRTCQSPKQADTYTQAGGAHTQAAAESRLCKLERQVLGLRGRVNGSRVSQQVWALSARPSLTSFRETWFPGRRNPQCRWKHGFFHAAETNARK